MEGRALKFLSITAAAVGVIAIALGAKALVDRSNSNSLPKPYDVAMYDVYTALIPNTEEVWLNRVLAPPAKDVFIRDKTVSVQDPTIIGYEPPSPVGRIVPENRFAEAVNSAIADYLKRNTTTLKLQPRFKLANYHLFARPDRKFGKDDDSGAFVQSRPASARWIELSAVGFNSDQTIAVVYFDEMSGSFWDGGFRMLQKRGRKWYLLHNQVFSDVIS